MNHFFTQAAKVSLLMVCAMPAWSFETQWMARVVEKKPCIESLGSVVPSQKECWAWTKRETAEPVVNASQTQIFVGGSDGFLHVVEPRKGRTLKRISLEGSLVSAPIVQGGTIVFATDRGFAYKLLESDLSVSWKTELDSGSLQSPHIVGDRALFVTQLGTVYALSTQTGEILWSKKRELPNRIFLRHLSMPIPLVSQVASSNRDVLAVGNPNGKLEFLDPKNGEVLDELQIGNTKEPFADVATEPALGQNNVFAASFNTGIVAVDRNTRMRKWELKEKGITQVAVEKGIVVAAGAKFVFGINADSGRILWKFAFKKGAPGTISIYDGKVFVGSDIDALYVLDLNSGAPRQILGSGLGFAGKVEMVGGNVLAMSSAGVLFLFNQADLIVSKRSIARN